MRLPILHLLVLTITLSYGCKGSHETAKKNIFSFSYRGEYYQIVSINSYSGEGTNFLTQLDDQEKEIFNARDLDQNGSIDVILSGNISVEMANQIYQAGIKHARQTGNYNEQKPQRNFRLTKGNLEMTIRTYSFSGNAFSNLFILIDREKNSQSIFMDSEADGLLDVIEKGNISIKAAQELYAFTIRKGIADGRIQKEDSIIYVRKQESIRWAEQNSSFLNKK